MPSKDFRNNELLKIAESVSRDKSLSKESVIKAMEEALSDVVRQKYGNAPSVHLKIDRHTGDTKIYNELLVVDDAEVSADNMNSKTTLHTTSHQVTSSDDADVTTSAETTSAETTSAENNASSTPNYAGSAANIEKAGGTETAAGDDKSSASIQSTEHQGTNNDGSIYTAASAKEVNAEQKNGASTTDIDQNIAQSADGHHIPSIGITQAKEIDSSANVGDYIREPLPYMLFDRLAVKKAKACISLKLKEMEKDHEYEEYKDKIGEMFIGTVDKVDRSGLTLKLGNAEAIIKYNQLLRSDHFKQGSKIKASLSSIDRESRGPQLIMSRTSGDFLINIMKSEIPEIYNGDIKIMSVSRDPGSRSKVSILAQNVSFDPIGACIGVKGARIKAVSAELGGEKIDILHWAADPVQFLINALRPIVAHKIIVDEEDHAIEVLVDHSQLSLAIGRRGQNIKLISELVKWKINVTSENAKSMGLNFNTLASNLTKALDIDLLFAQLLVGEGFDTPQKLAESSVEQLVLLKTDAIDEEVAGELIARSQEFVANSHEDTSNTTTDQPTEIIESKPDNSKPALAHLPKNLLIGLSKNGIKTMHDIANLSVDELDDILHELRIDMDKSLLSNMIDAARKRVYFGLEKKDR